MPPVLGPVSPSPTRLKSCAGSSGTTVLPSTTQNSDTSGPSRKDSSSTGCPSSSSPAAWARAASRSAVTTTPLPAARTVVLDHPGRVTGRRPEAVQRGIQIRWTVDDFAGGSPHARRLHDVLGECLGTLDAGRVPAGPEADDARGAHGVGHPEHQRHLGTDDHQVGAHLASQRDDAVAGGDVDVVLLGEPRGAGVAGSNGYPRDLRISAECQQQGMFTGTGADHQNAHDTSD